MDVDLKPIRWLGTTRDDIREQRLAIRYELGQQLLRVQMGLMPNNYKPVSTAGLVCTRYACRTPMASPG